jgi:hypothetical protein
MIKPAGRRGGGDGSLGPPGPRRTDGRVGPKKNQGRSAPGRSAAVNSKEILMT